MSSLSNNTASPTVLPPLVLSGKAGAKDNHSSAVLNSKHNSPSSPRTESQIDASSGSSRKNRSQSFTEGVQTHSLLVSQEDITPFVLSKSARLGYVDDEYSDAHRSITTTSPQQKLNSSTNSLSHERDITDQNSVFPRMTGRAIQLQPLSNFTVPELSLLSIKDCDNPNHVPGTSRMNTRRSSGIADTLTDNELGSWSQSTQSLPTAAGLRLSTHQKTPELCTDEMFFENSDASAESDGSPITSRTLPLPFTRRKQQLKLRSLPVSPFSSSSPGSSNAVSTVPLKRVTTLEKISSLPSRPKSPSDKAELSQRALMKKVINYTKVALKVYNSIH